MNTRFVTATDTTPAYRVSITPFAKAVYAGTEYKGAVLPMKTPGFFVARDIRNALVTNPADADGLWTNEQEAMDALARA
jgi:hypothetical protein